MGRNLSPVLCRELENLDKDADSRKNAMKALKSYVKDLDSKAIPQFLAQVSATKEPGSSSGEYTISLYEVLARVHGRNIVPQIENIMSTIIRTLSSSAGSFPLHQACAKVVPAIARYGIEPSMPHDEKRSIIFSLCKPLCDVLMGSPECLASGAALCLKALVESDNWRFASSEMVNELCLKVAGALEEISTQTNAHMGLVMALSKHNSLTVEAYARSLLRSGLQVLAVGLAEGNSQKRLSAIQMIHFLMKCVDSRSILSELARVAEFMEKCQADPMPFVRGAAFEAMQTAKLIVSQKGPKYERISSPNVGSNFVTDYTDRELNGFFSGLVSPESQTVNSFFNYDSLAESPVSTGQSSCNFGPGRRASRRLWNDENGGVDVSLRDGLFLASGSCGIDLNSHTEQFGDSELQEAVKEHSGPFSGFVESQTTNFVKRDTTPSPRRPRSPISIDDVKIFTTPRKLIRSLQDSNSAKSGCLDSIKHNKVPQSPTTRPLEWNCTNEMNENNLSHNMRCNAGMESENVRILGRQNSAGDKQSDHTESVSSTGDVLPSYNAVSKVSCDTCGGMKGRVQSVGMKSRFSKAALSLLFGLSLILPAIVVSVIWTDGDDSYFDMVPT